MKQFIFSFMFAVLSMAAFGQKYLTQSATIRFFSSTPMEDIEAVNNQVSTAINAENGEMVFSMLMTAFTFEKALMQEHFNEKYVESPKFPKAKFKGSIADFATLKLTETPTEVTVTGDMTIHGVTKPVTIKGTLAKKGDKIIAVSKFMIVPEEYDIKIPGAVRENIAKEIEVTVNATYDLINK
jgi:hypothetical protein